MRTPRRLAREKRTIDAMVRLYCRAHHRGGRSLCDECQSFLDYALGRLDRCVFGVKKPTCANCPVHCYKPEMREMARSIMRYSGPRMLARHPYLAMRHLLDGLKRRPERPGQRSSVASARRQRPLQGRPDQAE